MRRFKRTYRSIKNNDNNKTNNIIVFIIILMVILGVIIIKFGYDFNKNRKSVYNYTVERSDDYRVELKPNTFYASDILPAGGYYASKSVNSYIVNFIYNFKGSSKTDIEYNYTVTGDLIGTVVNSDGEEKEVWNRNYTLQKDTNSKQENIDTFFINKKVTIDYQNYNNFARAYENEYGIAINAVLRLRFNISYNINLSNLNADIEKVNDCIELNIPVTDSVTEVKRNYENQESKNVFSKDQYNNIIFYLIGGLFIFVAILIFIIAIIKNKKNHKDLYTHNINHIFKYYKDLIVTVNNEPDLSNLKTLYVYILDDLIDVAEQTRTNIIHYEVVPNEKSYLYVIVNDYVYIYVVTNHDLK